MVMNDSLLIADYRLVICSWSEWREPVGCRHQPTGATAEGAGTLLPLSPSPGLWGTRAPRTFPTGPLPLAARSPCACHRPTNSLNWSTAFGSPRNRLPNNGLQPTAAGVIMCRRGW